MATELCDSSLTTEAARSIKKETGGRPLEDTGISLGKLASKIKDNPALDNPDGEACRVYIDSKERGQLFFDVSFSRISKEDAKPDAEINTKTYWPVGRYATTLQNGGILFFDCTEAFPAETPHIVSGTLFTPVLDLKGKNARTVMTILLSVSRAVAEELGCLEEANLPAKLPEPSATWTPSR